MGHGASLLANGQVLVAGGFDPDGVTASAELYDPGRGVFGSTGSLRIARGGFTMTPLRSGAVLVAGGASGASVLSTAELYDPVTGTFRATGRMAVSRNGQTATLLRDGRVLVAGGSDGRGRVLGSVELYDPGSGRWSRLGTLRLARHKHGAAPLRDGLVLIVGGSSARDFSGRFAATEIFDPAWRRSRPAATLTAPRFKLPDAVLALPSGRALVAGGSERVELSDPGARSWATIGQLGQSLAFATATLLPRGDVFVAGGLRRDDCTHAESVGHPDALRRGSARGRQATADRA